MRRLEGINLRLSMTFDRGLDHLQMRLWKEYNTVLVQEELIWMQKSRCLRLQFGDRNTSFFHTATLVRRKRNRFEALVGDDGSLITDYDALRSLTYNFYRDNYLEDGVGGILACNTSFNPISEAFFELLHADCSDSEVKE